MCYLIIFNSIKMSAQETPDNKIGAEESDSAMHHALLENKREDSDMPMTMEEKGDQKFEEIGGFGRFQLYAYIAITFGINCQGWWIYNFGFLTQSPAYLCEDNTGAWFTCTAEETCTNQY